MTYRTELFDRVNQLMSNGPGQVSVRRISQIDDVRMLRAAQELLSAKEKQDLQTIRAELKEALNGCQAPAAPPSREKKKGLFAALLSPLGAVAKGVSKAERERGEFDQMVRQSGGSADLPAPPALLDAAEAWVTSHIVADRYEGDLSVLREPWEQAAIHPSHR